MAIFVSLFAACVIVFPIYLIHSAIFGRKNKEKALKKAVDRGNVVEAVLVKNSSPYESPIATSSRYVRRCVYEYTYRGKKYKYRCELELPADTLTLYFVDNPRKAVRKGELDDSKVCWPLIFGIVALIAYWVATSGVW